MQTPEFSFDHIISKRKYPVKTISDGGTVIHYHDYHRRSKAFKPMCSLVKIKGKVWREDDGVGAELCKLCAKIYKNRVERVLKNYNAAQRNLYKEETTREKRLEYAKKYYWECREAVLIKDARRRKVRKHARWDQENLDGYDEV